MNTVDTDTNKCKPFTDFICPDRNLTSWRKQISLVAKCQKQLNLTLFAMQIASLCEAQNSTAMKFWKCYKRKLLMYAMFYGCINYPIGIECI